MRFAMTAKTLVRERQSEGGIRDITARNVAKVTRFREGGEEELEKMVRRLETAKGLEKDAEDGKGEEEEDEEVREPWDKFSRLRERSSKKEDEQRESKSWQEQRNERRKKRDPNSGRRGGLAIY